MTRTSSNVLTLVLFAAAAAVCVVAWKIAQSPVASVGSQQGYRVLPAPFPAGTIIGQLVVGSAARPAAIAGAAGIAPEGCAGAGEGGQPSGLTGGVVVIEGIAAGVAARVETARLSIKACGFDPPVAIGLAGSTARIAAGSDHRVQASVDGVRIFDADNGGNAALTLVDPGLWSVRCASGHPWEQGWIAVASHPYQVVVDAEGRFTLQHVPVGTWTLRAWHPRLGAARQTVEVKNRETAAVEFELVR